MALIAGAHLGHDGVVRQLIAANAPLDHVKNMHWTAVIESIVVVRGGRRHVATLQAPVAACADLRLTDREGRASRVMQTWCGCWKPPRHVEAHPTHSQPLASPYF